MKTKIPQRINSVEDAKEFIKELALNGELFDFREDLSEVRINKKPLPMEDRIQLEPLLDQIGEIPRFDPVGFMKTILNEGEGRYPVYMTKGAKPIRIRFQGLEVLAGVVIMN